MATWNSRGLRGSTLEDLVNRTNDQYREKGLALIQKIPTPITPVRMDKENRHITLAYFDQRSTVDYIGAVQGIPVCFDAKECSAQTFPLANIHPYFIICLFGNCWHTGDGWKRADGKASAGRNWMRSITCRKRAAFWFLI